MFQKVSIQEIKNIRERLNVELTDKYLPFQRKEEVTSLLSYIDTWLEWREYQKPIKPNGTITPQKDIFKFKSKNIGIFKRPKIGQK